MLYTPPRRLNVGDRVAIVASASPYVTDEVNEGLDIIREAGLEPVLGPNMRNLHSSGFHAGTVDERADELMWAFTDRSIAGVIVATGGFGSAGVLPLLDFEAIAASRRVLLGMSDITALNTGILAGAGLISVNGQTPSIRLDKGEAIRRTDALSLQVTLELMMSDRPWSDRPFDFNPYMPRTVSPGRATGHAVGCNIDTFSRLLGTPYVPELDGSVLFCEDVHKDSEFLAREFLHMQLAGVMEMANGVVVGEFEDCGNKGEDEHYEPIEDVVQEYFGSKPCSFGWSFSHGPLTSPIPIGAETELDADAGVVKFNFRMIG